MDTVDFRIRVDTDEPPLDPDTFFRDELPLAIAANADAIVPALDFVAPRPMVIEVDGATWTLACVDDRVVVTPGHDPDAKVHVRMTVEQLTDLARDQATIMSMWAANEL